MVVERAPSKSPSAAKRATKACGSATGIFNSGVLVPFEDDGQLTIASPMYVEGARKHAPRKPAALGQHNEELLREAGYDDAAIARLREAKVVA